MWEKRCAVGSSLLLISNYNVGNTSTSCVSCTSYFSCIISFKFQVCPMILPASRFFLLYFYRLRKVSKESLKTAMQSLSLNGNRCLHCIILPVSMEGTSAVSPLAPLCNFTHTSHHSILRDKESTDFR